MMKRKFWKVVAAALVSSVFLTMAVSAAGDYFYTEDITASQIVLREEEGGCKGHLVTGGSSSGNPNNIIVESGDHNIILNDVKIDASNAVDICAFSITPGCKVNLTLEGNSVLKSAKGYAGIHVPHGAELHITDDSTGSLKAYAGEEAAGIGGQGTGGTGGTITIDGGTVEAYGGMYGAGIGGSSEGGAGKITINGGTVTATGGSGNTSSVKGSPGIGCGNACKNVPVSGGEVIINDGKVTAKGGQSGGQSPIKAFDINCSKLSSGYGKELIINANINGNTSMDKTGFNGIAWADDKTCYVYGKAIIENSAFKLKEDQVMVLAKENSLTIPDNWSYDGVIASGKNFDPEFPTEGGTVINKNNGSPSNKFEGEFSEKVILKKEDIEVKKGGAPYTGKDLFYSLVTIKPTRYDTITKKEYGVDSYGWTPTIKRVGGGLASAIIEAGGYEVTYKHPVHGEIDLTGLIVIPFNLTLGQVIVEPASIDGIYDGTEHTPPVTLTYNQKLLVEGKDYEKPEYTNNLNAGTASVTIRAIEPGNYTGTRIKTFKIKPASLAEAKVALDTISYTYDGTKKTPSVNVTLGDGDTEKTLEVGKDYEVKYLKSDRKTEANCIDAGTVVVQVKGKGNYEGAAEAEFTIQKIELPVKDATAENKYFDGTDQVKIIHVNLDTDHVLDADKGKVEAPTGFMATVSSSNVGTYKTVKFGKMDCIGDKGKNYIMAPTAAEITLTKEVAIDKKKGPAAPKLDGTYMESINQPKKFLCTLQVDPEGENYEYSMDSTEVWQESRIFDGIQPATEHIFRARVKEDKNLQAGTPAELKILFEKLEQEAPQAFDLVFIQNEDASYTAEIPYVTGGYYYFSEGEEEDIPDELFSTDNKKTDCMPNTSYTGYIKFLGDETHKPSKVTKSTKRTPSLQVAAPQISPKDGQFITSQEVTITCETEGAEIYYTTDGKTTPTATSTKYEGPFRIDKTTTVKAIAIKTGMQDSLIAEVVYKKADPNAVQTKVEKELGKEKFKLTDDLIAAGFGPEGSEESEKWISTEMSRVLGELGFNYDNIAFYEISLKIGVKDGDSEVRWEDATVDNFPLDKNGKGSLTVVMPYPEGTGKTTHDFAVCHMFAQTSERLGTVAGEIETPKVSKMEDGLKFTLTSTSPVAIGWNETNPKNDNNGGNNNQNPDDPNGDGTDNPDGTDGDGTTNPDDPNGDGTTNPDGTGTDNPDALNNNADGTDNPDGTDGTDATANADGTDAKTEDNATGLKALLPKTGDNVNLGIWIGVIVAAVAVGGIAIVFKRKNKKDKKEK